MADEDKEAFDEFAESSAAPANFGRQDHLRMASERRATREAEAEKQRGEDLSEKAQATLLERLQNQKPSWQQDGLGIRGNPQTVTNSRAKLVWPSSAVTRRADPEMDQGETVVAAEVPTADN